jgi:hypothetical protein
MLEITAMVDEDKAWMMSMDVKIMNKSAGGVTGLTPL